MDTKMNLLVCFLLLIGLHLGTADKDVEEGGDGMAMFGNLLSMMNGGNDKKCEFACPSGSKPARNPDHVPSSNGCGSFGFKLDTDIPGFESCCDVHDKCYDTCNNKREKCDEDFKKCLDKQCKKDSRGNAKRMKRCENMAFIMSSGATSMGCVAYKSAQHEACLCDGKKVPASNAQQKKTSEKVKTLEGGSTKDAKEDVKEDMKEAEIKVAKEDEEEVEEKSGKKSEKSTRASERGRKSSRSSSSRSGTRSQGSSRSSNSQSKSSKKSSEKKSTRTEL